MRKIESTSKSSEIKLVDKLSPERQIRAAQENVSVRWDIGLNKKRIAYFYFTKEDNEARLRTIDSFFGRHGRLSIAY